MTIAEHTSSTVRLFADDCVMYKPVKTIQDCEVLQNDLDQLQQWEKRWQLRFNARKCSIMRATHAKKKQLLYDYKLGGEALLPTNSTAYLGIELSSDLKWNTHEEDCLKGKSNTWESCVNNDCYEVVL